MEARAEAFKINPKYQEAIPRPTYDENRALDESIRLNGQLYPIIVNKNMVILDGHSRFEILQARGMMIKYQVFEFVDEDAEYIFVVESNIMKRNLNAFQKVEAMYKFIKAEKEKKLILNYDNRLDIIKAIKNGHVLSHDIAREIGMSTISTNRILVTMVEEYYLNRDKKTVNKRWRYEYGVLPKSEELLAIGVRKRKITISRMIGVSTTTMHYGLYLIENASASLLDELRSGNVKITEAYMNLLKNDHLEIKDRIKTMRKVRTSLKCPHCMHIAPSSEFKRLTGTLKDNPHYA